MRATWSPSPCGSSEGPAPRATARGRSYHWWAIAGLTAAAATALVVLGTVVETPTASASTTTVGLGDATAFAVLAHTAVTNTGASLITGDLGVWPGSSVTGTPHVVDGTTYVDTTVAEGAQAALGTAYTNAATRTPTTATLTATGLGGKTLVAGVYKATSTLLLTGTVTLNAAGTPNAVFIFQVGTALTTAPHSKVLLEGGALACNVFWQVGSSATLGTTSDFVGTVMAHTSVTLTSAVTVTGRLLAENAAVTLIDDTVVRPAACVASTTTTTTSTSSPTTPSGPGSTATGTGSAPASGTATGTAPGASTGTGAATGTGATTGTGTSTVIPVGAPETGLGGASRAGDDPLLIGAGALALVGAAGAFVLAMRRRRSLADGLATIETDGDG